jgi:toxin ParE1/3/4
MGYQVIFAPEAERDLNEIIAYIAQANPEAALKFAARLAAQARSLSELPHRGASVPRRPGTRKLVHGQYLIYYQIREIERTVEVLRFWHGARRRPKI